MTKTFPAGGKLSLATILAFASTSFPMGALGIAIAVYLPPYMASHIGVSLAAVGAAWMIVRLVDIVVDPILGVFMDRTRTPLGRYRVWMILGAPILMVATYALFLAPKGIDSFYLIGWLLVLYLATSILGLGHSAWGATLSTEYHERSRVFGVLAAVGVMGAVLVLIFPIIAGNLGRSAAQGVQDMGWFVIITTPLAVALCTIRTPETIRADIGKHQFRMRDYWGLIIKPDLMRLYMAQIALTLGPGWMSALYVFFCTQGMGYSSEVASGLLLLYILAGIVGAPLTARLAQSIGKHRTLMVTTTAYSLGLCTLLLIPKGNALAALAPMFWCGFMASGFDLMIRAMLADVADEVRLEQGKERLSLIYALNSSAAKIAAAFSIGLTYPLLAQLGFVATEGFRNSPEAIERLKWVYIAGPIFFVMLGGACVVGWKLDEARHAEIRKELERRDLAEDAAFDGAPILESITSEPANVVVDRD